MWRARDVSWPGVVVLAVTALVLARPSEGAWSVNRAGSGATGSKTMPSGNVPAGSVAGHNVTLTWAASQFAGGTNVPGYVVRRYDSVSNALQTILAGCSGTVAATTCTESGVPTGTWKYTITPAAGTWRGTESGQSAVVIVLI
jgi:hypothetical protein